MLRSIYRGQLGEKRLSQHCFWTVSVLFGKVTKCSYDSPQNKGFWLLRVTDLRHLSASVGPNFCSHISQDQHGAWDDFYSCLRLCHVRYLGLQRRWELCQWCAPVIWRAELTWFPLSSSPPPPSMFVFLPSLTPNMRPLTQNKGGNQSWYRCGEDVQSSSRVKLERGTFRWTRKTVCSNCFQRRQTATSHGQMCSFCLYIFLSGLFSKMNITLFYPSSRIICSIWVGGGGVVWGKQATVRRPASQVQALLKEYHVAAFYDLFNTRELNTAIYPAVYDMVWMR